MNSNLRFKNTQIGYQQKQVLIKSIDLATEPGDCIAIIGKNGCGKTTLIKSISGFIPPVGGAILVNDEDVKDLSSKSLAKQVGLVLTDQLSNANIAVRDLISYGRYPFTSWLGKEQEADKIAIVEAISLCEVTHLLEKKLYEISDGEKQLVMIARAIAQSTPIIILDEPTAHLDISNKAKVFSLMKKLSKLGKTVIFITHEIQLAMTYSSKIWLLTDGKIIEDFPENFKKNGLIAKAFNVPQSHIG